MTTEIPLSKLKQDRDKKKLSKTLKRQEFKWLDVHNAINLITGQLQIYLTTLNSIKQLPVEAKQILDKDKEFINNVDTLSRDVGNYFLKISNIINKIPQPHQTVNEATHMAYLDAFIEVSSLGDDVSHALMPIFTYLNIIITETIHNLELSNDTRN